MATVTKARITARKGLIADLPTLLPGELGLATDEQKVFMGMEPLLGSKGTCTLTELQYEFTVGTNPITESFVELLNENVYSIVIDPHDSTSNIEVSGSLISFEDEVAKLMLMDYLVQVIIEYLLMTKFIFTIIENLGIMQKRFLTHLRQSRLLKHKRQAHQKILQMVLVKK